MNKVQQKKRHFVGSIGNDNRSDCSTLTLTSEGSGATGGHRRCKERKECGYWFTEFCFPVPSCLRGSGCL
jgi:hypothetical protein